MPSSLCALQNRRPSPGPPKEASVMQPSASHVLRLTCSCCCTPSFVPLVGGCGNPQREQLQCAPSTLPCAPCRTAQGRRGSCTTHSCRSPLSRTRAPSQRPAVHTHYVKQQVQRPLHTVCSQISQEPTTHRPPGLQAQTRPAAPAKRKTLRWPELAAPRHPARALGRAQFLCKQSH